MAAFPVLGHNKLITIQVRLMVCSLIRTVTSSESVEDLAKIQYRDDGCKSVSVCSFSSSVLRMWGCLAEPFKLRLIIFRESISIDSGLNCITTALYATGLED